MRMILWKFAVLCVKIEDMLVFPHGRPLIPTFTAQDLRPIQGDYWSKKTYLMQIKQSKMIDSYKRVMGGESIFYYKRRFIYIKQQQRQQQKNNFIISLHGFVDWFGFFSSLFT